MFRGKYMDIRIDKKTIIRKNIPKGKRSIEVLKRFKREALSNKTDAEICAEKYISSRLSRRNFRVQAIYSFRRFDFFFPCIRTVIEIDGEYHGSEFQHKYDIAMDRILEKKRGIFVLRVNNFDLIGLESAFNEVLKRFKRKCKLITLPNEAMPVYLTARQIRKMKKQKIA